MVTTDLKTVSIFIRGMSCEACAAHVKWVLKKVPGIHEATVDTANSHAMVEYRPSQASFGRIISALEGKGYQVGGFTGRDLEVLREYLPLKTWKVRVA
jgi:copper chaperone CopZ